MTDLLLLPGDGIGPEVTAQARRVAETVAPDLKIEERLFGGCSLAAYGTPLTDETLAAAKGARAVLMGAVDGTQWAGAPRDKRPEAGLLNLRAGMEVYANLRPALCFPALADASTLKRHLVEGLDLMIVRELTGGIYFGSPRFIEDLPGGGRRAVDTQVYTTAEIERVARVAFQLARGRRNLVHSAEKSNVMDSGLLWRQVVTDLHAREFPDVRLEHILADNAAMQIVRDPRQFDVLVTDNLFGDILSDAAAMLTGSLGMLPSAALGDAGRPGLYEPIHGSAPDIAGQGLANPLASILSLEMAFRWSLDRPETADRILAAVVRALDAGARTRDLGGSLTTVQMGDAVLAAL
ncbi:3-isopropylmalate dehydrogenase [Phenylobacterium sp.]|uniref:3-isopropylmalate dehydrogenase n=1 Tax=Phenylobacterium sp. TaxID=1871053 RepID=UPI0025F8289D|nr:3-isopropylmalate dehydrogenase [Phenylobacterium sp.]MCA6285463.1 3-isopropylmalate dehydrogenase [Phenylobacterium sp.]MCA6288449.1 3-isopropylmalate dehydrogenase [Phenylobacterium sp.]MCA6309520.1 3-isopropylmalate dehydrogenase [Phenylobacterium sp.]MCA6323079.1 3-isopropylmalate dehydrogenase [Phenylobacterium sp.]MCA6337497.1 3-isopropylmalate dehydrogenase [Phenylobacterium sp.]